MAHKRNDLRHFVRGPLLGVLLPLLAACSSDAPTAPDPLQARDQALTAALSGHVIYQYAEREVPGRTGGHVHLKLLDYRALRPNGAETWQVRVLDYYHGLLSETHLTDPTVLREAGQWDVYDGKLRVWDSATVYQEFASGTWTDTVYTPATQRAVTVYPNNQVRFDGDRTPWTLAPLSELPALLAALPETP